MIPTRGIQLFFTAAVLLVGGATGWCGEPQGRLELVVEPTESTPARGEAFDLLVRLLNAGQAPLKLYHPESIHMASHCWKLSCRVTSPEGRGIVLLPEVVYASLPVEKREHYRQLAPGDSVTVDIHIQADDPMATHTPSGWVGLIPISETEPELLTEKAIKALYGIQGEIYIVGGGEQHWLAIRGLMKDVFNRPGGYRFEIEYDNSCTHALEFSEDGKGAWVSVDQAWSGRLSNSVGITIEE